MSKAQWVVDGVIYREKRCGRLHTSILPTYRGCMSSIQYIDMPDDQVLSSNRGQSLLVQSRSNAFLDGVIALSQDVAITAGAQCDCMILT